MATVQVSHTNVARGHFGLSRPLEQEIAERSLATALYNYHRVFAKGMPLLEFKTWFDLTDVQQAFLLEHAVPAAVQAIWKGR